jgi:hypothetical protein
MLRALPLQPWCLAPPLALPLQPRCRALQQQLWQVPPP